MQATLPPARLARSRRSYGLSLAALLMAGVAMMGLDMVGLPRSGAVFADDYPVPADFAASRIFRDERTTTAFYVEDASSGSASDGSSANAFATDGRYFKSRTWPVAFDGARYLDLETNDPLPAGLSASNLVLNLRIASDAGTGSACVYLELQRASSGVPISSHGSSGSPLACTSGSAWTTISVSLGAVSSTDVANDLRVRLFVRDSAAGALRVDQAAISGDTPYVSFTLYPILTRELYSGLTETLRWGLAGP
jgi:hypothetical protein